MPILFLIFPIHITFTAITTIHIYTRTHDTLSATAFVAQLAERRTRFAGSWVRVQGLGVAFFVTGLGCVLENLHTRKISLSFILTLSWLETKTRRQWRSRISLTRYTQGDLKPFTALSIITVFAGNILVYEWEKKKIKILKSDEHTHTKKTCYTKNTHPTVVERWAVSTAKNWGFVNLCKKKDIIHYLLLLVFLHFSLVLWSPVSHYLFAALVTCLTSQPKPVRIDHRDPRWRTLHQEFHGQ